jgi:hypothetical protein
MTVGPTHSPIQMDTGILCWKYSGWGLKLTTNFHPLPRIRISGTTTFSPLICLIDVTSDFTFTSEGNGNSVNTISNNSNIYKKIYSNNVSYRNALLYKRPLVGKLAQCGGQVQHPPTHATASRHRTSTGTVAYERTHPHNYKVNVETKTVRAHGICNFSQLHNSFDKYWLLF